MTVIVMSKSNNIYYMTSDGRTSQGWMGIASDNTIKVHSGKECIYGVCGNASAKLTMKMLLNKTCDPTKLLKLLHHKDYTQLLQHSTTLVATVKYGCYTIHIAPKSGGFMSSATGHNCEIITWDDKNLPQIAGSGSLHVKALLSQWSGEECMVPDRIKNCIQTAYLTNHTIGGEISQISLDITKYKKPKNVSPKVNKKKKVVNLKVNKKKVRR